jgi:hypothetical protein
VKLLKGDKATDCPGAEGTESTEDSSYQLDQPCWNDGSPMARRHTRGRSTAVSVWNIATAIDASTVTTDSKTKQCNAAVHIHVAPREGLGFHSFYGSVTALQIYTVLVTAVVTRRAWVLHGITLILLNVLLERIVAWQEYHARSHELQQALNACRGMYLLGKNLTEGALEGNSLNAWLMGSALELINKSGKLFIKAWWQVHSTNMNQRVTEDLKRSIREAEELRRSARNLFHNSNEAFA